MNGGHVYILKSIVGSTKKNYTIPVSDELEKQWTL